MIDDAIVEALSKIKKVLKQKYPNTIERIFYLLLAAIVTVIPVILFDYWLGRICGLLVISLFFIYVIWDTNKKNKKTKLP